jgi:hypothetical protein
MSQRVKRFRLSLVAVLLLLTPAAFSQTVDLGENCNLVSIGATDTKGFLEFDRELRGALSRQDAAAMALLVKQSLRVNSSRGTYYIGDPRSLQLRFHEIFPHSVRDAVLKQRPTTVFCNMSGIMYGNGTVWVDLEGERYRVKTINLPETTPTRPATARMLNFVCETATQRIIVDESGKGVLRYRAWGKPRALTDKPDKLLNGIETSEGSGPCEYSLRTFADGNKKYVIGDLEVCTSGSDPPPPQGAIGRLDVLSGDKTEANSWCY